MRWSFTTTCLGMTVASTKRRQQHNQCHSIRLHVSLTFAGRVYNHSLSGIAAVSNIGNDANWTGHILAGVRD